MRSLMFDNRSMFAEMDALFRDFDVVFRGLDGRHGLRQLGGTGVLSGPIETDDGWVLTADLPGVAPEDLELTVTGRTLVLEAQRTIDADGAHHRERRSWNLSKQLALPDAVDVDGLDAELVDGVLTIRLPRVPETAPRRITVAG